MLSELLMTYVTQIIPALDVLNYILSETLITDKDISVVVVNKSDAKDIIRVNLISNVTATMSLFQLGRLETITDQTAIEWKYIRFPVGSVFTQLEMNQLIGLFVKQVQLVNYDILHVDSMKYIPLGQTNSDIMTFIHGAAHEYCLNTNHPLPAEYIKYCTTLVWQQLNAMDIVQVKYTEFERALISRVERIFMN